VYSKLAEKQENRSHSRQPEYMPGETFSYLGRSYRLRLVDPSSSDAASLRLCGGWFELRRDKVERAETYFRQWYVRHGHDWLKRRIGLYADRIGVPMPTFRLRDLGLRWASCSRRGSLNFHWRTMLLPSRIIDYLVVHELVHLHEPHHGAAFWARLGRAMPDYQVRKEWLAEFGGHQ
jgi:predicted metal-dependent hydrolase